MKILIIYGDDSQKSLARLRKIIGVSRSRGSEILNLIFDTKLNFPEQVSSGSLFGGTRLFVVDDGKNLSKKDLEWLRENYKNLEGNLVIYFDEALNKTLKSQFPREAIFEEYKLAKNIFDFLDAITPGNAKNTLVSLHELTRNSPPEFIFALISKRLKELYWVKSDSQSLEYPKWRKNLLARQAANFPLPLLAELINDFAEADIRSKTSGEGIIALIDLILLKKLK